MPKFSNKALVQLSVSGSIGTLDFSAYPSFDVRNLYAVIDQTANVPLYLHGVSGYGFSSLSGTLMTLQAPMTGAGPPAFTVQPTDTLAVTYDEGVNAAVDLVSLFAGEPQMITARKLPYTGAYTRDVLSQELLRKIYAALIVLCRMTIADKAVNDSDIESLLNDELNNLGS